MTVNTVHGLYAMPEDDWKKRAVVYSLERLASTCSDAELVQNPEDLVTLRRVLHEPAAKLTLLGNGVDLTRFGGRDDAAEVRAKGGKPCYQCHAETFCAGCHVKVSTGQIPSSPGRTR